jgi:hypothetical protein
MLADLSFLIEAVLLLDKEISMAQTLTKTMKAVAIDRFGGIETLETHELPVPECPRTRRGSTNQYQLPCAALCRCRCALPAQQKLGWRRADHLFRPDALEPIPHQII